MKVNIKVPRGYEKLKTGQVAYCGDFVLYEMSSNSLSLKLEWQKWQTPHAVKRGEFFIRKISSNVQSKNIKSTNNQLEKDKKKLRITEKEAEDAIKILIHGKVFKHQNIEKEVENGLHS